MSKAEAPLALSGYEGLPSKGPRVSVDRSATPLELAKIWGRYIKQGGQAFLRDEIARWRSEKRPQGITEFGKLVVESKKFPGIQGLDDFKGKAEEVVNSPHRRHLLVVANHPDLLRSGSLFPLWISALLTTVGEITGEDPYVFARREFVWAFG